MQDERIYWIWLSQTLGSANYKSKAILNFFNIRDFYKAGEKEFKLCGFFSIREIEKLVNSNLEEAKSILDECQNFGYEVICITDFRYPKLLKEIRNPPCVLYCKSQKFDFSKKAFVSVSMVGTRAASEYGLDTAYKLAFKLAKNDITVVSGGALGIDSAAHKGALDANGKTVAVLGCGINCKYLAKNELLREKIFEKGAILSEFPANFPAVPRNFPLRNRIISGISLGTIVVEADKRSGSLITARLALKQNRDLFSVPGGIFNKTSTGTNLLIKHGAKPLLSVQDILKRYKSELFNKSLKFSGKNVQNTTPDNSINSKKSINKEDVLKKVSQNSQVVFKILKNEMYIDEIYMQTNLSAQKIASSISELEIYGLVKSLSGERVVRA
ncbi:MAG: DNA-processing protein DprA [Oscillospiraceae bacterium]|jgi:DNA processing protein|nr:DNA-processing protein DprA [Oscillospiraceae bacterium]